MTLNPIAIARVLLPTQLVAFLDKLAEAIRAKLQGETLRAVMYGAAGAVWVATRVADVLVPGRLPVVSIDMALIVVTIAVGVLTELARRWVVSPATFNRTVAQIVTTPPASSGPIAAAVAAGVPADAIVEAAADATGDETLPDAEVLARLDKLADSDGEG